MGYRLKRREKVAKGIRRIACEQIDQALEEIADDDLDLDHTVHQVRKRCKKLRGLIRLVRGALGGRYRKENACFRDAARLLSGARDAETMVSAMDRLLESHRETVRGNAFEELRGQLTRQSASDGGDVDLEEQLKDFQTRLRGVRERLGDWPLRDVGFAELLDGFSQTYDRGRQAMQKAYVQGTAESFHQWRKRVKYHSYHLRVLEPVWPAVLEPQRKAAEQLGDYLGDDHDLAVLAETLGGKAEGSGAAPPAKELPASETALQTFLALLTRRREELQAHARPLGERIFAEKPKALTARIRAYRSAWR
jgi:CHAD domain-containing protein